MKIYKKIRTEIHIGVRTHQVVIPMRKHLQRYDLFLNYNVFDSYNGCVRIQRNDINAPVLYLPGFPQEAQKTPVTHRFRQNK